MTTPPFDLGHHRLENRYCFCGDLELLTPLRISSGRAGEATDAPFIRAYNGTPYIPGSSLRGALRSELERLLAGVGGDNGLRSCTLFSREYRAAGLEDDCPEKYRKMMQAMDHESQEKKNRATLEFIQNEICQVCQLFGATMYASHLVINDAAPQCADPAAAAQWPRLRDGVGIDRDTGAAKEGAKFDYEVIETGPTFVLKMTAENLRGSHFKIMDLALQLLMNGLYVGGKRSGGLGRIGLKPETLVVTGFSSPKDMWDRLQQGHVIHQPLDWSQEVSRAET
jgi:CRISPR-associated RAMP protein (TIGR02581 family)